MFISAIAFPPPIIALTETKIRDKPITDIAISGLTFMHVNSNSNADGC